MEPFDKDPAMYNSKPHQEHDLTRLHQHMLDTRLAVLVSQGEQGLLATHLPVLVDTAEGDFGTVYAHLAGPTANGKTCSTAAKHCWYSPAPMPMSAPAITQARPKTPRWCRPGTTWRCTLMARPKLSMRPSRYWLS